MTITRRRLLAGVTAGSTAVLAGCGGCRQWNLTLEPETSVDPANGGWRVAGTVSGWFGGSASDDPPYEDSFDAVVVEAYDDAGDRLGTADLGTIAVEDGSSADSDCHSRVTERSFGFDVPAYPYRITVDAAEHEALCRYRFQRIQEVVRAPDADPGQSGPLHADHWEGRDRPCPGEQPVQYPDLEEPPRLEAAFEVTDDGETVQITHAGGDVLDSGSVWIAVGDERQPWGSVESGGRLVEPGDEVSVTADAGAELVVEWDDGEIQYVFHESRLDAPA